MLVMKLTHPDVFYLVVKYKDTVYLQKIMEYAMTAIFFYFFFYFSHLVIFFFFFFFFFVFVFCLFVCLFFVGWGGFIKK